MDMAFIRWRGNSATLLTTVYEQGKSRQVRLARLGTGYEVSLSVRRYVAERYPNIPVDWTAINTAMAHGPMGSPPLTAEGLNFLEVENRLREWAQLPCPFPRERDALSMAAEVLVHWRARQNSIDPQR